MKLTGRPSTITPEQKREQERLLIMVPIIKAQLIKSGLIYTGQAMEDVVFRSGWEAAYLKTGDRVAEKLAREGKPRGSAR
jgi:hypothetical protein